MSKGRWNDYVLESKAQRQWGTNLLLCENSKWFNSNLLRLGTKRSWNISRISPRWTGSKHHYESFSERQRKTCPRQKTGVFTLQIPPPLILLGCGLPRTPALTCGLAHNAALEAPSPDLLQWLDLIHLWLDGTLQVVDTPHSVSWVSGTRILPLSYFQTIERCLAK